MNMRYLLIALFSFFVIQVNGQSLVNYKDTLNRFSINIPTGWRYGVNKNYPSIKLIAYRTPLSQLDTSKDNFNINIIETPNKDLNTTFADFLKYLPEANDYKLIATGDTTFNGLRFKWLIETHTNGNIDIQMYNYDFITFKNGKTYVLTMVTFSNSFINTKPLFDSIASSFSLLN